MLKIEGKHKTGSEQLKKTIDMVTRLYVHAIRTDTEINPQEINILYSLLTNLFKDVDISWEVYVRNIIESPFDIVEVLDFLKKNLNRVDKLRIILSLLILARKDRYYEISEITDLIDIAKHFGFDPDPFVELINQFEIPSMSTVYIPFEMTASQIQDSLFRDFIVFGRAAHADIRFRNPKLADHEIYLFAIDTYLFMATGTNTTAEYGGNKLKANQLFLFDESATLNLAGLQYEATSLWKIYGSKTSDDDIVFTKSDYDFLISKHHTRYSILLNRGSITQNKHELPHGRRIEILYDDTMQIRGYAPFTLLNVIRERSNIGVDNLIPSELFICFERDFFYLNKQETGRSLARIEFSEDKLFLHPPKKGWTIYKNEHRVESVTQLALNADTITIHKRKFRINDYYDLVEIPIEIHSVEALDLKHYFPDGNLALDSISFEASKGELIGILGQSGSGKSTLLKTIISEIIPTYGNVRIDGKNLCENLGYYSQFFGYVPQDDLLYPNLTVYENLWYRGRLRLPNISAANLDQKIINLLRQVNLIHRKDSRVGDYKKKLLSGGERKRLNIALELLFEPTILVCDEPTSGLSFSDAEQVIDILKQLTAQDKIVLLSIHQPNSSVFRKFDKVLLMDMGGRQVYYGEPDGCFAYFDEELSHITFHREEIELKKELRTSDYMYDIITYPEYNDRNEQVYEQVNRLVQPKRMFTPEYWRDKYKRRMLLEIIQLEGFDRSNKSNVSKPKRRRHDLLSLANQFAAYTTRSFKMKLRNRSNALITFLQAPLLSLVIAFILRRIPGSNPYSYHENNNIGIYVFVSIIVFIFLGLSNSIEEILDERKIILREKMINLRTSFYLASKLISLTFFALVQVLLYTFISALILKIPSLWDITIVYFLLCNMVGYSLGLMTSAFLKDNKAIINLLPLILIPQIIFGGAVIEFERMNRQLTLTSKSPIPEIVQFIPSRWLFEGLVTAYAKRTVFHNRMAKTEKKRLTYKRSFEEHEIYPDEYQVKLAELRIEEQNIARKWSPDRVLNAHLNSTVGMMDGAFLNQGKNVFLSSYTRIRGWETRTWLFNMIVILLYLVCINLITITKLKFYFRE